MRRNGILMPVSALPSAYGIGSFGKEAYKFVDILEKAGQSLWQILPLGPTSYGDSPYQSFSTFAGNPYFIDLELLTEDKLLTKEECDAQDFGNDAESIDYAKIYKARFKVLRSAYENFKKQGGLKTKSYQKFCKAQADWLEDYALFMAVKNVFEGKAWNLWDEAIRLRKPEAVALYQKEQQDEIDFYKFQQYLFNKQWKALKAYAADKKIAIIGDIPIYVAFDSADTWANPELFQLDKNNLPVAVAGCPPDGFSATGQLWGNPLYNWKYHKKTHYAWWIKRMQQCFKLYDIVRIDHFRGFDAYYAIPYGDKTAENGSWQPGPGMALFKALKKTLGDLPIIAEDLGFLTDSVRKLLKDTGYPGMKVLQFAFDSREESDYLPHNYTPHCVVYTGTHDNDTIKGWYQVLAPEDKKMAQDYLNNYHTPEEEIHWDYISLAMRSVAETCIIPLQDFMGLGSSARINTPSTLGDNWKWRMKKDEIDPKLIQRIRRLTEVCGRTDRKKTEEEPQKEIKEKKTKKHAQIEKGDSKRDGIKTET